MVERAVAATQARAGILALVRPARRQHLNILADVGYPAEAIAHYLDHAVAGSQGIVGRAIRTGETQLVAQRSRRIPIISPCVPEVQAQLTVPSGARAACWARSAWKAPTPTGFTPDMVDFIEHLAGHAALAIDNAARYRREREQNRVLTRRAEELAAILRVGNTLRAELPLDQVLQQVVEGVASSLGFRTAILSLVEPEDAAPLVRVAAVGIPPDDWAHLKEVRRTLEEIQPFMQPQFQISQSYFIPHTAAMLDGLVYYRPPLPERCHPGEWHPDDMLLVPLVGKGGAWSACSRWTTRRRA